MDTYNHIKNFNPVQYSVFLSGIVLTFLFLYMCVQVLDIAFDYKGHRLVTASSDATACIWNVHSDFKLMAKLEGHREEVSKVISLLVLLF
jgi:WD40 repeat protein